MPQFDGTVEQPKKCTEGLGIVRVENGSQYGSSRTSQRIDIVERTQAVPVFVAPVVAERADKELEGKRLCLRWGVLKKWDHDVLVRHCVLMQQFVKLAEHTETLDVSKELRNLNVQISKLDAAFGPPPASRTRVTVTPLQRAEEYKNKPAEILGKVVSGHDRARAVEQNLTSVIFG